MNNDNNKMAFNKILEEDEEYFEFVDEESLCTACKLEIDNENLSNVPIKQENSIHFEDSIYSQSLDNFDNCPELRKATRSLSRISFDQNDLELAAIINDPEHQTNHQAVSNNIIDNNNADVIVNNSLFNNSPSFICTGVDRALKILEKDQEDANVKKNSADVTSSKNTALSNATIIDNKKKLLDDKETQTDSVNEQPEVDNPWVDNQFLSEEELEKIDHLINEQANGNFDRNNKRKYDNGDIVENGTKKIKVGGNELNKSDCDLIVSNILKREKKCLDCSNDLYEYSEYLDEVSKALLRKTPSTNIEIPTPPVLVGYDNHFDFKNEKRYVKLPIQKIKIDSNKMNGINGVQNSTNIKSKIYPPKTVASNQVPLQKNRLSLPKNISIVANTNLNKTNNQVNITPRNTLRQSTIKEAFAVNKENRNKTLNHIKSINNTIGSAKVNANSNNNTKNLENTLNGDIGKDKCSDSSSMYNFNPFHRKNNIRK